MQSETETIDKTYRAYFTVFQMANPRAITPYYHVPALFVTTAGTFALNSTQEAEQFFERLLYGLRSRGVRSVVDDVQVKPLSEDLALVNARSSRYADRDLIERQSSVYMMRKQDGVWRIATATVYDPSYTLQLS